MSDIQTLEDELQEAFVRGELRRLLSFAWWCANQAAVPEMSPPWREAIDLAASRAREELHPAAFASRADEVKSRLPIAATVVGLKRGAPNAMRLLTIAAALDTGPLTAALQASRNLQRYEALVWARANDNAADLPAPVVELDRPRVLNEEGAPPSVSELRCAKRQLQAWQALA